jgi:hypothetical protein
MAIKIPLFTRRLALYQELIALFQNPLDSKVRAQFATTLKQDVKIYLIKQLILRTSGIV